MKHFLRASAASATVFGLMLMLVVPATAETVETSCALTVGKPYKSAASATVYVITEGCKKRPVFNPDVFFSHYTGWDEIAVVEASVLASIPDHPLRFMPWGKRKEYKSGSLVKTLDDPKVYLIVDGKAYPIQSENAFKGLGFSFDKIQDVSADALAAFEKKAAEIKGVDDAPVSLVFKYPGEPKVYVLKNEDGVVVKSHVADMQTLKSIAKPDSIAVLPKSKQYVDSKSGEVSYMKPEYKNYAPDSAAPTVAFTAPAADATLTGTVSISATASDDKAVAWVKFKIDGNILAIDEAAPYETTVDTSKYPNGKHTLYVMSGDKDGKYSTMVARGVTLSNGDIAPPAPAPKPEYKPESKPIDASAPTVSFTAPAEGAALTGKVMLSATAADDQGVAWVKFRVGDVIVTIDETAPYSVELDTATYPNGTHTLHLMVGDHSGKYGSDYRTVTFANGSASVPADRTAPTVAFTGPVDGATVSGTITISATAADASDIAWVKFKAGDQVLVMDETSPYSVTLDTTTYSNGTLTLYVMAGDEHNNYSHFLSRTIVISNP